MTEVSVEIPGKVMLGGEYAVMSGMPCVAASTSLTMTVRVSSIEGDKIRLVSGLWSEPRWFSSLDDFGDSVFEDAVKRALPSFVPMEVSIISDLKVSYGVGSSSALRLGVLTAIDSYLTGSALSKAAVWAKADQAWQIQRQAQGQASGYDIATQVAGGWVHYRQPSDKPLSGDSVARIGSRSDLVKVFVGGKGEPTAAKVGFTYDAIMADTDRDSFFSASRALTEAWSSCDIGVRDLVERVAAHRAFLAKWGLVPEAVSSRLKGLSGCDTIWSFKTTGAGGEDAILLVGESQELMEAVRVMKALGWLEIPGLLSGAGVTIR